MPQLAIQHLQFDQNNQGIETKGQTDRLVQHALHEGNIGWSDNHFGIHIISNHFPVGRSGHHSVVVHSIIISHDFHVGSGGCQERFDHKIGNHQTQDALKGFGGIENKKRIGVSKRLTGCNAIHHTLLKAYYGSRW